MYTLGFGRINVTHFLVVLFCILSACSVKKEKVLSHLTHEYVHLDSSVPVTLGVNDVHTSNVLRIYIEGDGRAWISKYQPSGNPTPTFSLMMRLMNLDDTPSVAKAYMARPCQFFLDERCEQKFWLNERHSAQMVNAMNMAVDALKERFHADQLELVGHSGGGTMAVLIAAKRSDVRRMITIAGDLDVDAFTQYHKVTPMAGSLNPVDFVNDVKAIPQLHLVGGKDKTVPELIARKYEKTANSPCVKVKVFDAMTHSKGWETVWADVLKEEAFCGN